MGFDEARIACREGEGDGVRGKVVMHFEIIFPAGLQWQHESPPVVSGTWHVDGCTPWLVPCATTRADAIGLPMVIHRATACGSIHREQDLLSGYTGQHGREAQKAVACSCAHWRIRGRGRLHAVHGYSGFRRLAWDYISPGPAAGVPADISRWLCCWCWARCAHRMGSS